MKRMIRFLLISIIALAIAGCGSEGGVTTKTAVAKLSLTTPGVTVNGIALTISLPEGVYVKTKDTSGNVADGVVTFPAGTDQKLTLNGCKYTPAPGKTSGGTLHVTLISLGYTGGQFAQVQADILNGYNPAPGDFRATFTGNDGVFTDSGANIKDSVQLAIDPQIS